MDADCTIKSVKEEHVTLIRTDGVILKRKEKKMIHHETKKAEKPDIFYQR